MSGVLAMESTAIAQPERLPRLIEQAAAALAKATTAAEVLEAREMAALVYDAAKAMARLAKAKQAHDEIMAACRRAQADALRIEALALCRFADEYDAAQARGEVAKHSAGNPQIVPQRNDLLPSAADLGFTRKMIMRARKIRDAEKAKPGIVEKTLAAADEPTRARLMRAVEETLTPPKPSIGDRPVPVAPPKPSIVDRPVSPAPSQSNEATRMIVDCLVRLRSDINMCCGKLGPENQKVLFKTLWETFDELVADWDVELDWDEE
jgi:hypothetical protein